MFEPSALARRPTAYWKRYSSSETQSSVLGQRVTVRPWRTWACRFEDAEGGGVGGGLLTASERMLCFKVAKRSSIAAPPGSWF
jgi:hypothetical protein